VEGKRKEALASRCKQFAESEDGFFGKYKKGLRYPRLLGILKHVYVMLVAA
jgi:hypothetical protein